MTLQADLTAVLKTACPRVFTDFAPSGTARPFVTFQLMGGRALGWLDRSAADKRHSLVQIDVWSEKRSETTALIQQIEAAMRAATAFKAWPNAEPLSDNQDELGWYGALQDFSIYSNR